MLDYTGRLYTFGCSMTSYFFPTWADILGKEFAHYENWGEPGAGNTFIYNSVIECLARNKFNSNDTIIVMWSGISRIDYYNKKWIHNKTDSLNCPTGDEIVHYANMYSLDQLLTAKGIKHHFWTWVKLDRDTDPAIVYKSTLDTVVEIQFPRLNLKIEPKSIQTLDNFKNLYHSLAGSNWPAFSDITGDLSSYPISIQKEVKEFLNIVERDKRINTNTTDLEIHPSPLQYLETITKNFPNIHISDSTVSWVNDIDNRIRNKLPYEFVTQKPKERL